MYVAEWRDGLTQRVHFEPRLGKLGQQVYDRLRFQPGYGRAADVFDGDEMMSGRCEEVSHSGIERKTHAGS
jgi:hypothetical protein